MIDSVKKTLNVTTIFIIPTLKIPKESLKNNNFINGYVKDAMLDVQYDDCVYLLFKPSDLYIFRDFLDSEYERADNIVTDYDYPDGYVVVVYKLDSKYNDDFELIKQGKYSKTSSSFQALFPKTIKLMKSGIYTDEVSLQFRVFKKTKDLIKFWEDKFDVVFDEEQEVWHGFDLQAETLTKGKLKEYDK